MNRPPAASASPVASPTDDPTPRIAIPERLGVLRWPIPDAIRDSHDPRSAYVETFWLPILGPSSTLLMRRLAEDLEDRPDGFEISSIQLSREIGLGTRLTRKSPIVRTVNRCEHFNLVRLDGDVLHVRCRMPHLSRTQTERLSPRLAELHQGWKLDPRTDTDLRRGELIRAAHLARTLLALGETPPQVERQLERWRFGPAIVWHALQWAQTDGVVSIDDPYVIS